MGSSIIQCITLLGPVMSRLFLFTRLGGIECPPVGQTEPPGTVGLMKPPG